MHTTIWIRMCVCVCVCAFACVCVRVFVGGKGGTKQTHTDALLSGGGYAAYSMVQYSYAWGNGVDDSGYEQHQ